MNNIHKRLKHLLLLTGLMFLITSAIAQEGKRDTVVIVKEYNPTISNVVKISTSPVITDTFVERSVPDYRIESRTFQTDYQLSEIPGARFTAEPLTKLYSHLIKGGYGTYKTPYAEYIYNSLRSRNYMTVFKTKHLSSTGQLKDYGYSGFSDNEAKLSVKRFLPKQTLGVNVNVERNVVHYYGYNPEEAINKDLNKENTRQRFFLAGGDISFGNSTLSGKKPDYEAVISYFNFSDIFKTSENDISLESFYALPLKADTSLKSQHFKIGLGGNFNTKQSEIDTNNRGIIYLKPEVLFKADFFRLQAGISSNIEASPDSAGFRIFPTAELGFTISEDILLFYLGVDGGIEKNTFHSMANTNPFIGSSVFVRNSYKKYDAYAGFRGSFSSTVSFNLTFSNKKIAHNPFFVNDINYLSDTRFDIIYDDLDVMNFHAELTYKKTEKLRLMARADYYIYKTLNEAHAWHKPDAEVGIMARYNLKNKIIATLDVFYTGERYANVYNADNQIYTAKLLSGFLDANIGLEYRYSKLLGAFIRFHNIAGTRYEIWNNYPNQRFSLLGGLSYSF